MADNIQQIKDKLDIIDVISGYLKVAKSGVNFKARCPFHNEKTPSFFISPERQIWHCFGCSKGGDMFGFIQEIEGVEFSEALKILAQRAGVQLENFSGSAAKDEKSVLYEICEIATRFFEKQLYQSGAGKRALAYLTNRGLAEETMKEFRLGFAPAEWESLVIFLRNCGYKDSDIVGAGLAIKRDSAEGVYDRFRSRIVFPIFDLNGQVVGFTGRVFEGDEKEAKYINTPQTAVYDKSRVLYGLNKAKADIRREDKCVIVEGNMDALMSYQAGAKNVVATSGTALTPGHLKIIQRYTSNLGLCFDTDQAGAMATRKGIGMCLAGGLNVKVIEIKDSECKDPADYVRKYGAGWLNAVGEAKPVMEFYFNKVKSGFDPNSAESKKMAISVLAPFLKRLSSQVEKAHWISQLAFFLRTKETAIEADILMSKDDLPSVDVPETTGRKMETAPATVVPNIQDDILSQGLLSVVMKNPVLFREDLKTIRSDLLDSNTAGVIARITAGNAENISDVLKEFRENEQSYKLEFAYLRSQELWKDFKDEELKSEFNNLIKKMEEKNLKARLENIGFEIGAAADKDKKSELISEANKIMARLGEIQKI